MLGTSILQRLLVVAVISVANASVTLADHNPGHNPGSPPSGDPNLTGGGVQQCSASPSRININELHKKTGSQYFDFIELKVLENNTDLAGWKLCYARNNSEECVLLGQGNGVWDSTANPDLTDDDNGQGGTTFQSGTWITYASLSPSDQGGEVLLLNSDDEVEDYLAYSSNSDSCASLDFWDVQGGCGVCFDSKDSSQKNLSRISPDGTGDWGNNGDDPTPQSDNSDAFLSAEWRFDSCDLMADGQVPDSSGNGLTAFVAGSGVDSSIGKICNAGLVGPGKDDYLFVNDNALLDDADQLTVMAWVNPSDLKDEGIFSKRELSGSDEIDREAYAAYIIRSQGNPYLTVELGLNAGESAFQVTTDVDDEIIEAERRGAVASNFAQLPWSWGTDSWVHIALVFDGSLIDSERGRVYVYDGSNTTSSVFTVDTANLPDLASSLMLGAVPMPVGNSNTYTRAVFDGLIDEVVLIKRALTEEQIEYYRGQDRTCPFCSSLVDHYSISYDSTPGITCQSTRVTATAFDSSDQSQVPDSGSSLTFSGAAGCSFSPATVSFDGVSDSVSTQLFCPTAGSYNVDVIDADGVVESGAKDPDILFELAKFEFYDQAGATTVLPSQIAGKWSNQAPGASTLQLRAITTDPDTGQCVAALQSQTQPVAMSMQCIDPLSCQPGSSFSVTNSAGAAVGLPADVALDFDANGRASIPINYSDVGLVMLSAALELPGEPDAVPPLDSLTLTGDSDLFVVKPAGFCVIAPEASSDCLSEDASCSVFKVAGDAFELEVRAVGWQTGGEVNADFCTGNPLTPNYQLPLGAPIILTQSLKSPVGGATGALAVPALAIANDGVASTTDQSISEVGVYEVTATPPDYMGESMATSTSAPIGRFIPSYFGISAGLIEHRADLVGCTDPFSYMGEPFDLSMTLTAYNSSGIITQNYRDDFAKLDSETELGLVASDGTADLSTRLGLASGASVSISWANGEAAVDLPLAFERDSDTDGPYLLSLGSAPVDDDAVQSAVADRDLDPAGGSNLTHVEVDRGEWRYGRAQLANAFGSELENDYLLATQPALYNDPKKGLVVALQVDYFDGSGFVRNSDDNCSTYTLADFGLVYGGGSTPLPNGTTAVLGPVISSSVVNGAAASAAPVLLQPPGAGNQGSVELIFDVPAWLEFDWDSGVAGDEDPAAIATFGRYRGHDRLFLWQEQH